MGEKTLYLLFTDTGTWLSRLIRMFTKQELNHVSIGLDAELKELYSFGRKVSHHPFRAGFVRENRQDPLLRNAACEIYCFHPEEAEYREMIQYIKQIESMKHMYKYNFIGLVGVLLQIEIQRKAHFFCSQFAARVLSHSKIFQFEKPDCFVTPADLRKREVIRLIYKGKLKEYQPEGYIDENREEEELSDGKQSILLTVVSKCRKIREKRFWAKTAK